MHTQKDQILNALKFKCIKALSLLSLMQTLQPDNKPTLLLLVLQLRERQAGESYHPFKAMFKST